jgi:hypothetical protein
MSAAVMFASIGCFGERERPLPSAPEGTGDFIVEVLEPRPGATVVAGGSIDVRIRARDEGPGVLTGVGFVARRYGIAIGATIDSVVIQVPVTAQSTQQFRLLIPAQFPTNTQVDIVGIAFGQGTQVQESTTHSVIVIRCTAGQQGCS